MADPLHKKNLEENSVGCVMKSPRFMVSNSFNFPRATRGVASKTSLPSPDPTSVKEDLIRKVHKPGNRVNDGYRRQDFMTMFIFKRSLWLLILQNLFCHIKNRGIACSSFRLRTKILEILRSALKINLVNLICF